MTFHLIVGAGPVGNATARLLAGQGHHVRIVTRSGSGPADPAIERVAADARDRARLADLAHGAAAIYNCANPPYTSWARDWPPLAAAFLHAAETSGAVLAVTSNLYVYGPVTGPMTERHPLAATGTKGRVRVAMWEEARRLHEAGRIGMTEVRGSDFFGPEVTGAMMGDRAIPRVLAGKTVRVLGRPDVPHTWTYVPDLARLLVVAAADPRAWGRAWHAPSNPPISARAFVGAVADAAGVRPPAVKGIGRGSVALAGAVVPMVRELKETFHQFDGPWVMDSTAAESTFDLAPTPLDVAVKSTVDWFRPRP